MAGNGAEIVSDTGKAGVISMAPIDGPALVSAEHPNIMQNLSNPDGRASLLPKPAAERYRRLREAKEDAHNLFLSGQPKIEEIRIDIIRQQQRLARVEADWRLAGDVEMHKAEIEKKIANLKGDIAHIEERQRPHSARMSAIGRAITRADKYISAVGFQLKDAALPKVGKSETLDAVVARITSLRDQVADIISRPWPAADAKERARREVEFLADEGRVNVSKSVLYRNQLGWPVAEKTINLRGFGKSMADMFDVTSVSSSMAVVCWLFKDAILAKLYDEIDAAANDGEAQALTAEQRTAQLAQLTASIEAEQRTLAAIIWQDEAFDLIPDDIDPRALLGLSGPEPRELH
ncbi:MAG: hypothetical protein EOS54_11775 [Mesorhizobium sp.]|uniref:hypothetical protein n=1 Tax=Mesorhizobium sp. TaxID=1871066 RepID=UPI000FE6AEA6|nr:hypothetical protein [Mesorhizobium sp.]RWC53853.1 MAG: hypothetical protein EOS54_11775 [Mesorhizobium sp.]TIV83161.1 MAG: hypothetical protein E5V64_09230 [Mesorhizobium sp.]TIX16667.1 MAG: hypothetical protein E5V46_01840 [Mesorhizobium sp.]